MTSQTGKRTIAVHILPYISRSKDNQTLKFGQLIEDPKCGGETSPKPFSIKSKLSISLG